MRQPGSIAFSLNAVFFFFFLLTIILGLFSIWRLSDFNRGSADIRGHWLPSIRFLSDLNNFTSDFRAAEATNLLSSSEADFNASENEIAELDQLVAQAQRGYESLGHSPEETKLYALFCGQWTRLRTH